MSYKTIFSAFCRLQTTPDGARLPAAIDAAIDMARAEDAHLEVLAVGVDQVQIGYFYAGASAAVYQDSLRRAQDDAKSVETALRARLTKEDVRWSLDMAVSQLGGLAGLVGARARFADLVIAPRPYGDGREMTEESLVEAAMFDGQAPVLVIPDGLREAPRTDRIVVAWNESPEALSAVRQALPLLRRASVVDITVIDPPAHSSERSDPGGLLSQWMARHGVRAEVTVLARTLPRVSEVIIRHLRDSAADMLVMGAYGHSRFREAILGGATREMLEHTPVPTFFAR